VLTPYCTFGSRRKIKMVAVQYFLPALKSKLNKLWSSCGGRPIPCHIGRPGRPKVSEGFRCRVCMLWSVASGRVASGSRARPEEGRKVGRADERFCILLISTYQHISNGA